MATTSDSQSSAEVIVRQRLLEYKYVRFVYVDLHGISKHKLIPARNAHKFLKRGTQAIAGIISVGPRCEVWFPASIEAENYPNCFMKPDLGTLRPLIWTGTGEDRTGVIICESHQSNGEPHRAYPRYVARQQLKRLEDLGYSLYSTFEYEFMLLEKETNNPVFEGCDYSATQIIAPFEGFFKKLDRCLEPLGVDIEAIHTEHGPGMFETPVTPVTGLQAADNAFLLKQTVKELADMEGWQANFMAKVDPHHDGCGVHYNFSVWEKNGGRNAFYKEDEHGRGSMSEFASFWTAGFVRHLPAITALFSPTVNCYRRLHQPWAPDNCDWNIDDRTVSLRVKCHEGETGTYMENRVPSSLSNPYLVLAATVAAGLDGVQNHLTPPPAGPDPKSPLPFTLSEALDALEADKVICDALGSEFIEWFVGLKRAIELKDLSSSNPKVFDADAIAAEIAEYAKLS